MKINRLALFEMSVHWVLGENAQTVWIPLSSTNSGHGNRGVRSTGEERQTQGLNFKEGALTRVDRQAPCDKKISLEANLLYPASYQPWVSTLKSTCQELSGMLYNFLWRFCIESNTVVNLKPTVTFWLSYSIKLLCNVLEGEVLYLIIVKKPSAKLRMPLGEFLLLLLSYWNSKMVVLCKT